MHSILHTHICIYFYIIHIPHTHINHRKPVENPIFTEDAMRAPEKDSGNQLTDAQMARWQDVFCCHRKIDEIIWVGN